ETPQWDRSILVGYAIARALVGLKTGDQVAGIVLAGLYHVARVSDLPRTDQLLRLLLQIWLGDHSSPSEPFGSSDPIFGLIENSNADSESLREFGSLQMRLTAAHPRALRRLYDILPHRSKLVAKRALALHGGRLGIHDTDPTHELIDLVVNHVG